MIVAYLARSFHVKPSNSSWARQVGVGAEWRPLGQAV
jgi:hypothetical protein